MYFGPCGANGKTFVEYLQKIPNVHALPEGMNPASWMLDVLGGTDSSNPKRRRKRNVKEIEINRGKQFTTSNDDETEEFRECLEWFHLSRTVQILSRRRRWYALSSQTMRRRRKIRNVCL